MASTNTRFTALGMSGCGKTCYVLGMYYQMITGYKGFSLKADGDSVSKLETWMDQLDDGNGQERFPAGTGLTEVSDYQFKLKYALKDIMTFNWIDYAGGTLRARENNPESYQALTESIEQSTVLYLFLDGELFCEDDPAVGIRNLKKNVRTLNAYLNEYTESHPDTVPPIVFVITKGDLVSDYWSNYNITQIMHECFDMLMCKDIRFYVTMVSLGEGIAEDNYSGDVEPIGMHLPFFIGIYHQFLNFCLSLKREIEDEERRNRGSIAVNQSQINQINNRGWLGRLLNGSDISGQLRAIESAQETIRSNSELLMHYKKLMQAVSSQLLRDSRQITMYEDGIEREFDAAEIVNL
ncbi:MAG: hypothetical protein IJ060_08690 [Oscillospiraceae bacterium]|nr:hypothetical protein [Oscillospiraceae bacterium]